MSFQLFDHKVALRNVDLLLYRVAWHRQHLHAILQCWRHCCYCVCSGNEQYLWQVKWHIEVTTMRLRVNRTSNVSNNRLSSVWLYEAVLLALALYLWSYLVLMFMYYTVCYFTGIFYAVVRQISMLFIDNNISVFCTIIYSTQKVTYQFY